MTKQENISPNEKDRKLAEKIGQVLPHINELSQLNDPFAEALLSYKNVQDQKISEVNSERLWTSIESEINTPSENKASILKLYPAFRRVAVAASIVLVAVISFIIYQANRGDILIGESFASIETIELNDGSMITLRPYTKLYQSSISADHHDYQLHGEAYFEIIPNPDRIFSVSTGQSKVEVLGTKFVLSDWGSSSEVYLEEGRVRFTSTSTQESVELVDGQASSVNDSVLIPKVIETNAAGYKDWLRDELVFNNKSARVIFNELEQHFNIKIEAAGDLDEEDLSGSFRLDDLDSVLQNLELVLNGNFTQTGEQTYTFKAND